MYPQSTGAVHITGKIVDELNRPIAGAITKLTNSGLVDTSTADGEFSLSDKTRLRKVDGIKGNLVSLRENVLRLSCRSATSIKIEVFNIQGRTVFQMEQNGIADGIHTFPIPLNNGANNLHLLRIQVNGHAQQFKIFSNQLNGCTGTHEFHFNEKQVYQSSHNTRSEVFKSWVTVCSYLPVGKMAPVLTPEMPMLR
jgi:hypothetical protein